MSRMGRPINVDLHTRIAVAHAENPHLGVNALAAFLGCSAHTVRAVSPQAAKHPRRGHRLVIPADLYRRAEAAGGVLAVLERALRKP